MQDTARRVAVHALVVLGVVASVATTMPSSTDGLATDELGPEEVVLTADAPAASFALRATLALPAGVGAGNGEVGARLDATEADARVELVVTSTTTGEEQAVTVDLTAQESTRLGVDAFAGCSDATTCEDEVVVDVELENEVEGNVAFSLSFYAIAGTSASPDDPATVVLALE